MHVLDLFSGIGGFSLGLERAGMKTVAFCEIDPYCRQVLSRHWPGVKIHHDITTLDGAEYAGTVDVVCGGFPCQPWSVAGQQRGEQDERHLWPEMLRVIREVRPRYVVAENVRGIVKLHFDTVAAQLEAEGFTVWPFLVPASAVGAPHRRERLWVVGYAEHHGSPPAAVAGGVAAASDDNPQGENAAGEPARAGLPGGCRDVADAGGEGLPQSEQPQLCRAWRRDERGATTERGGRAIESGVGGSPHGVSAWLDGSWEDGIPRVATGVPNRVQRIQALGNAVVPQLPELIGHAIMVHERQMELAA